MTWEAMPAKERTQLRVSEENGARAKCKCGCGKFAVVMPTKFDPATSDYPEADKNEWQLVCLNCKERHA